MVENGVTTSISGSASVIMLEVVEEVEINILLPVSRWIRWLQVVVELVVKKWYSLIAGATAGTVILVVVVEVVYLVDGKCSLWNSWRFRNRNYKVQVSIGIKLWQV
jgi:hypothetical protein